MNIYEKKLVELYEKIGFSPSIILFMLKAYKILSKILKVVLISIAAVYTSTNMYDRLGFEKTLIILLALLLVVLGLRDVFSKDDEAQS